MLSPRVSLEPIGSLKANMSPMRTVSERTVSFPFPKNDCNANLLGRKTAQQLGGSRTSVKIRQSWFDVVPPNLTLLAPAWRVDLPPIIVGLPKCNPLFT